jgi:hypothetical protein
MITQIKPPNMMVTIELETINIILAHSPISL